MFSSPCKNINGGFFSDAVQDDLWVLHDGNFYQALHIHTGSGDLDLFSRSQERESKKAKAISIISVLNVSWLDLCCSSCFLAVALVLCCWWLHIALLWEVACCVYDLNHEHIDFVKSPQMLHHHSNCTMQCTYFWREIPVIKFFSA